MIKSAAIHIFDKRQNKEIIIPCLTHDDAYKILQDLGYSRKDFVVIKIGYLDNKGNFLDKDEAYSVLMGSHYKAPCFMETDFEDFWWIWLL